MYTKGVYKEAYNKTHGIDATNKMITLEQNKENENVPYPKITKIQLRLFDCDGELGEENLNIKFFSGIKALIILFDIASLDSFNNIKNKIIIFKNFYNKLENDPNNLEDNIIKQSESFNEIPILIVGNKSDLAGERKVEKAEIDELIINLNKDNNFSFIKYYEISVKENLGINDIFQDIIFNYFKRKIDINVLDKTKEEKKVLELKDNEIKKGEKEDNKRPSLDKKLFIFHQMLDKLKKNLFLEINNLKEENKKANNKNKQLEEKIEIITKDLNNENNALKEKINTLENKTNDLEQELKNKNKEIEILKNQVNDLILTNKKITLKFKISGEGINEVISINTNGEAKLSEVLSLLYELCPGINDLNIKGFCIEGKENEKIDEMKTVNENKLVNDSLILLIV